MHKSMLVIYKANKHRMQNWKKFIKNEKFIKKYFLTCPSMLKYFVQLGNGIILILAMLDFVVRIVKK